MVAVHAYALAQGVGHASQLTEVIVVDDQIHLPVDVGVPAGVRGQLIQPHLC
ncbi:hypothetical protein [Streptomyces corynorhini]|uniref:hypothetical protein n=1 Tax=Streptomyces corynorhini TaxID=2282652 RepID=UPI001314D86F|nr:hypothetical protein [Streptomyces corynorhini]